MKYTLSQQETRIKKVRDLLSGDISTTRRTITDTNVRYLGYFGIAFPSQAHLGDLAAVRRETANRSIKTLSGEDLPFDKVYRHRKTCIYWLNSWFINHRHRFYDLIPSLNKISLLMLFSLISNDFSQNVTPNNNINYSKRTTAPAKVIVPQFGNGWVVCTIRNSGYDYYDPDYGAHEPFTTFIYKPTTKQTSDTTTSNSVLPLKERVMSNKSVIDLIADTYGLSVQQEQMLEGYSEEALQYALKQLVRQNKTKTINAPVNWIAKVASTFGRRGKGFINGKMADGVVDQPTLNPGGHSPMAERSHLSNEERIAYAVEQESIWEEIDDCSDNMIEMGFHTGYPERVKANWKRIQTHPEEFPRASNHFMNIEPTNMEVDLDYEEHLNEISKDKSNPVGYKEFVRTNDKRRTVRK